MSDRLFTILITGTFPTEPMLSPDTPQNISVEVLPFISIVPVAGLSEKEQIAELSRLRINAIFTSAEAVRVVKPIAGQPIGWKVWSTSGPTQTALKEWLGDASVAATAPDATSLAEKIVAAQVNEVVFFCADQRRDALPARMRSENIRLEEITVYKTIATPVHLEQEYDAILFFSPSAVESFFSVNRIAGKTAVFALGTSTAESLRGRISGTVMISSEPDKTFLLQTAIDYAFAHLTL